jgi:hypothetical protein
MLTDTCGSVGHTLILTSFEVIDVSESQVRL